MNRKDRIKLDFIRNWKLPGKERLSHFFAPSDELKKSIKDGIVWLSDEDIAIYTRADNYIEWTILSTGTYENEISKLIRISVKPGDNCLDVGGNIGLQSIRMAQCTGSAGQVYAFEPLQHLQNKFLKNVALNRLVNVSLFPVALSDAKGETDFAIDENAWNQGTFSLNHTEGSNKQMVAIKIADDLPEISALNSLSLVKIDVEGFEFNVMRGLKKTLEKHRPRIIFEYDDNYWVNTGQNITDCFSFLEKLNYKIYQVTPVGCELVANAASAEGGNLFCIPY